MKLNKKSSLNLSVEAIIILILAITMLGLGLGFIKGMFGKVSKGFVEKLGSEPEPPLPTGSEPIMLSRDSINTYPKTEEVIKISVYNPTNQQWAIPANSGDGCANTYMLTADSTIEDIIDTLRETVCSGKPTEQKTGCIYDDKDNSCFFDLGISSRCPYIENWIYTLPSGKEDIICGSFCYYDQIDKKCHQKDITPLRVDCNTLWFKSNHDIIKNTGSVIGQGEIRTLSISFSIPSTASEGITLCHIGIDKYDKEFTINIKK